jgi:hypothetical protein
MRARPRLTHAYGFPYPRVAVCLHNNWDAVWALMRKDKPVDERAVSAADNVGHYYHLDRESSDRNLRKWDKERIKQEIAATVRSPMTRLLLMTKGLDVSERIKIVAATNRVSGDLYERMARVPARQREFRAALDSGGLEELARKYRLMGRVDGPGILQSTGAALSPMRVHYSAEQPDQGALGDALNDDTSHKTVDQLNEIETARFLCHWIRVLDHRDTGLAYRIARKALKRTWTGGYLASSSQEDLEELGTPSDTASLVHSTVRTHVKQGLSIGDLRPCKVAQKKSQK